MTKTDRLLLALQRAARNPKYREKVLAKIKEIKDKQRIKNWLGQ